MKILGISAFYHDSAAALLADGKIIAAAQEERFTRIKHDSQYPSNAIEYVINEAGISLEGLDYIAFYDKPFLKFERLLETYLAYAPRGFRSFASAMPVWIKEKLFQKDLLLKRLKQCNKNIDWNKRLIFSEHHLSHAASAFYPSPFTEAVVLTMDGVGEWCTSSVAIGKGNDLKIIKEIHFPHSLGMLYSAFTYYTGFKVNSGEYKLMGLAPYGTPRYRDLILDELIDIKSDGSYRLNMRYFDYCTGLTMTNSKFDKLFGGKPRRAESVVTQREMDIAASIQAVTEEIILRIATGIAAETGQKNLCLAGGVALNCVANGKLVKSKIFDKIWVQPAAGDAGGALGAALVTHNLYKNQKRFAANDNNLDIMSGSYLGPNYSQKQVRDGLEKVGAKFVVIEDEEKYIDEIVKLLAAEKAIGWFQGRMEFGPRALGARSIIADARSKKMQKQLNLKVKYRESFRPFAPAVLREDVNQWFDLDEDSPYMLIVADVVKEKQKQLSEEEKKLFGIDLLNTTRSEIPAVTHVDYSARVQTVHKETNPRFYALLKRFKEETNCPVLVNTSFNVRGEPIVCSPEDAFRCFLGTELDVLAIENCILYKEEQDPALREDYKEKFALD